MGELGKTYDAMEKWKNELHMDMTIWKTELKDHFDVVVENLRHDMIGTHKDKIQNHEDRIVRLEHHARIA